MAESGSPTLLLIQFKLTKNTVTRRQKEQTVESHVMGRRPMAKPRHAARTSWRKEGDADMCTEVRQGPGASAIGATGQAGPPVLHLETGTSCAILFPSALQDLADDVGSGSIGTGRVYRMKRCKSAVS